MSDRPWIVALDATHGADSYAVRCLRCGQTERAPQLPMPVTAYVRWATKTASLHRKCKETP